MVAALADPRIHYTPNRWMALLLTALVAARIVAGLWWSWSRMAGTGADAPPLAHALQAGGVWAVGGMLLAYAAVHGWGVDLRHRRLLRARGGA